MAVASRVLVCAGLALALGSAVFVLVNDTAGAPSGSAASGSTFR